MTHPEFSQDSITDILRQAGHPLSVKEIARAAGVDQGGMIALKRILKSMVKSGQLSDGGSGKVYRLLAVRDKVPEIAAMQVTSVSVDGDIFGQQLARDNTLFGPVIELRTDTDKTVKEGDHVLSRLREAKGGEIVGKVFKVLGSFKSRVVLGQAVQVKGGWRLKPVNRKVKDEYILEFPKGEVPTLQSGDLVEALAVQGRQLRQPTAKLHQVVGKADDTRAISLISLHEQGLRVDFPQAVLAETEPMDVPPLGRRTDLRDLPLVTIDGEDARDFDDAVYAQATDDAGFRIVVAIADVSHYVRHGSQVDQEAYKRGNSTYFPDRVLPMLPEKLSNDLCSLRPDGDRACLAIDMRIDAQGELLGARVLRGLMRSRARLTYTQVQAAADGMTDALTGDLMGDVIRPLYDAYKILVDARARRGALDLDRPERQVVVDASGKMTGVRLRARYDSHRLIEEFMILANVAAAQLLEAKQAPCMYRIHDKPKAEKVDSARTMLDGFGVGLPPGILNNTAPFNHVLERAKGHDFAPLVSEIILRSQSQAIYAPKNIGHFGLALKRYAHFTSPIRRYADLLVHRALIAAYDLGDDGLDPAEGKRFEEAAAHISACERTSMEAERSAIDRFTASFLEGRMGATFTGRISAVTKFGLFVTLDDIGADGLVPIRMLPADFYVHEERQHALIGRRSGRLFRLCAPVEVRILEANKLTGTTTFELLNAMDGAEIPGFAGQKQGGRKKYLTADAKSGKRPPDKRFKNSKRK